LYSAELHGKLPSAISRMEDILTSNVFSFFKHASRHIFLKGYLNSLGFKVSDQAAIEAEFLAFGLPGSLLPHQAYELVLAPIMHVGFSLS